MRMGRFMLIFSCPVYNFSFENPTAFTITNKKNETTCIKTFCNNHKSPNFRKIIVVFLVKEESLHKKWCLLKNIYQKFIKF